MERIVIRGIRFDGKWIGTDELYPGIIAFWLLVSLFRLLSRYHFLSKALADQKSSVNTLKSLNKLLDIEKKKFAKMARRDDLTQLYNRAGARDIILRVQENYRTNKVESSIILFDIDDFKKINDELGHSTGDQVLIELSELLLKNTRPDDHVIRWGGEEFVIICENSPLLNTVHLAEKLRSLIISRPFVDKLNLSCSFGVSVVNSDNSQSWFEQADKNLYKAKQQGKNQVVS
jgi:diguanylate cyclase (GGDEF)-like protein